MVERTGRSFGEDLHHILVCWHQVKKLFKINKKITYES
jgi:hypothetical protein